MIPLSLVIRFSKMDISTIGKQINGRKLYVLCGTSGFERRI
jgi:hypothetical protein